jgi:hypothetical protein
VHSVVSYAVRITDERPHPFGVDGDDGVIAQEIGGTVRDPIAFRWSAIMSQPLDEDDFTAGHEVGEAVFCVAMSAGKDQST